MDICKVAVERLMPAGYNPRIDLQPDDETYKNLQQSIEAFGYIEPIIWNERTGHVIGGHQRLKVLLAKGYSEIEVSRIDVSEEDEKLLNVALNKITGRWDMDKLEDLLRDIQDSEGNILLTGFSQEELDDILNEFEDTDLMDFFADRPQGSSSVQQTEEVSASPAQQTDQCLRGSTGEGLLEEEYPAGDDGTGPARTIQCPNCGRWIRV